MSMCSLDGKMVHAAGDGLVYSQPENLDILYANGLNSANVCTSDGRA